MVAGHGSDEDEVLRRLTSPPFLPEMKAPGPDGGGGRPSWLRWLSSLLGDTWQQRWEAMKAEDHPGKLLGPAAAPVAAGQRDESLLRRQRPVVRLLMLICGDAIGRDWRGC